MTTEQIAIEIHLAWWWPLYVTGLLACCLLFHTWVDEQKFEAMAGRALRVRKAT